MPSCLQTLDRMTLKLSAVIAYLENLKMHATFNCRPSKVHKWRNWDMQPVSGLCGWELVDKMHQICMTVFLKFLIFWFLF